MTTLDRNDVYEALGAAGFEEEALYEDYSGRAMYGATCIGIVTDQVSRVGLFYRELAEVTGDEELAERLADAERQDSMGLSAIIYWPGVTV